MERASSQAKRMESQTRLSDCTSKTAQQKHQFVGKIKMQDQALQETFIAGTSRKAQKVDSDVGSFIVIPNDTEAPKNAEAEAHELVTLGAGRQKILIIPDYSPAPSPPSAQSASFPASISSNLESNLPPSSTGEGRPTGATVTNTLQLPPSPALSAALSAPTTIPVNSTASNLHPNEKDSPVCSSPTSPPFFCSRRWVIRRFVFATPLGFIFSFSLSVCLEFRLSYFLPFLREEKSNFRVIRLIADLDSASVHASVA